MENGLEKGKAAHGAIQVSQRKSGEEGRVERRAGFETLKTVAQTVCSMTGWQWGEADWGWGGEEEAPRFELSHFQGHRTQKRKYAGEGRLQRNEFNLEFTA